MTDLNNVTNQLLNEYNKKFNNNYNDIVQLNSTIQNKEEIIIKTQEVILYKERNIIILQYLLYYTIIIFVLTILFSLKELPLKQYLIILVFLFFVLVIACYVHLTKYFNLYNIGRKLDALKVGMITYAQKVLEDTVTPYECTSQCANKDDTETDEEYNSNFDYENTGGILNIDPSLNVWKNGDVPVGTNISDLNKINKKDSPQPFFGTSYPKNTYYECKWLGNSSKGNMPIDMRQSSKKYSSIPCNYKPNNTEISRWFCEKDPNSLKDDEISKYCQKNI